MNRHAHPNGLVSRSCLGRVLAVATAWLFCAGSLVGQQTELPGSGTAPRIFKLPLGGTQQKVVSAGKRGGVNIASVPQPFRVLLKQLAALRGKSLALADPGDVEVTVDLRDVDWNSAMDAVTAVAGYTWSEHRGIIHVTRLAPGTNANPVAQGRNLEVFKLDYALAANLEPAVRGLLSPVGNVYSLTSSSDDNRQTIESIVVEDIPMYLDRVAQYIAQVDIPPRQVLIEAHVLQVELRDGRNHGVNYQHLMNLSGHQFTLSSTGLANAVAPQAFFAQLGGGNLTSLVELMQSTTDAKTLASPKILVVNGQQARIQVGQQLGFRVTTTTETSTQEGVQFLDVGVVLEVTPRISRDGRVLMRVKPKVSNGEVNADTGLPEEETAEVETDVLLPDGQGIVIGGLIQERDIDTQSKLPWLGNLKHLGFFFQRRARTKQRNEIIITLLPRVVPFDPDYQARQDTEFARAELPLLHGPLCRMPRPEPRLQSSDYHPNVIRLPRVFPFRRRHTRCQCVDCRAAAAATMVSGPVVEPVVESLPTAPPDVAPSVAPGVEPRPPLNQLPGSVRLAPHSPVTYRPPARYPATTIPVAQAYPATDYRLSRPPASPYPTSAQARPQPASYNQPSAAGLPAPTTGGSAHRVTEQPTPHTFRR